MRKTLAAATVAASLVAGGVVGAVVGTPSLASAAETTAGAASWVQEALTGLVSDGTITQAQADAVEAALDEARPERGHGPGGGFGDHVGLSAIAEALQMTEDEVRAGLAEGQTIAELAAEAGVDPQAVIDAIVAAQQERLAEAVEAGELTQEEADELLADAEERAAAIVNGEAPAFGGRGGHHHGPGRGMGPRTSDSGTSGTTDTTDTTEA
jgi:polyhydroxyalkanoate synthesis regulator phasin